MTRDAGDTGSNPALGKQWSHEYPIDVPATPTLPYASLRYQEALDWRNWTTEGCSFGSFFCPRSFDRAVMIKNFNANLSDFCHL